MSKFTRSERAAKCVLPLAQAVFHAIRDAKGGIASFAATYGGSQTTYAHKTDPARTSHKLTIDEFELLLGYTRDPRLMDSLCAAFSDDEHTAYWFDMPTANTKNDAEMYAIFGELADQFGRLGKTLFHSLDDHEISADEAAAIKKVGNATIRAVKQLVMRAEQMAGEV